MTANINSNKSNHIIERNSQFSSRNINNKNHTDIIENNDWLFCVKWLIDCGCLSLYLVERYLSNELTLSEFANALRDGEILCNLANFLLPGSIDTTLINKRAHMSQMLCLKNIRLFLDACKSPLLFNMDESDLFDEHMLYEFDLARVIKALSILSDSKFGKERGIEGFNLMSEQLTHPAMRNSVSSLNSSNCLSQSNLNSNDDIYYNIMPTETETPDSFYTDASFLLGNQSLNENQNDNGVYQQIVQQPQHSSNPFHLKRDYVIREILNTEENFINGLNTLMDDFLKPLSKILNETDRKCICINIDSLIRLHQSLYDELYKAVQGGPGMTGRICTAFETFKLRMMREYAEYFSCIDRSLAKCDALTNSQTNHSNNAKPPNYASEFRQKLEECRKASKRGNFKLTDLLRLPYQRVLKYHLLFNELLKQTDVDHSAKDQILKTKESMCEVGNYLNECERDKENLTQTEKIMAHLTIDMKSNLNQSLKSYGHYIKDDKFRVKSMESGERIARTRTFFLFELALIICKAKGDLYSYKEALLLEDFSIEDPAVNIANTNGNSLNDSVLSAGNTGSLGISTSVVNIGLIGSSGANSFSLVIFNSNKTKAFTFFFKNQEQKKIWKNCLIQAKQKIQPDGQRHNKHLFKLTNFDHEMIECNSCKKYLLGIFFQGYKCEFCSFVAHKNCLIHTPLCTPPNPTSQPTITKQLSNRIPPIERSPSFKQQQSFIVRAIYKYDGRPKPPEFPILTFNEGDLIQVTDEDDDEWWRGFVIKPNKPNQIISNKDEGYFPSRHVKHADIQSDLPSTNKNNMFILEGYPWFAPVDRMTADLILNRIQNIPSQTLFMVRCRQEGGYAISIKCNGLVDHIKINVTSLDSLPSLSNSIQNTTLISNNIPSELGINVTPSTASALYSIDQRNFSSVINLVKYYSQNTLRENFPQLETTLGLPYREALPTPISFAIAIHDYNPMTNPNNTGEQIELKRSNKYYIINKEPNGWWRVFNTDGLIGYAPGGYLNETVKI